MTEPWSGYPLPTDTQHVSIESRQYRLFNFDLGEGISRMKMLIAVLIFVPWFVLMAIVGVSLLRQFPIYIVPPALLTFFALATDPGGRPSYAKWLDRARYLWRRALPLIEKPGGGQGVAPAFIARAEWVLLDRAQIQRRMAAKDSMSTRGSKR